ncbi:hypothetical protein P9112_012537 [Eukaryota sp. TZLM1-RC]
MFTAGNKPTMDIFRNRANKEDIPLRLTAMRIYSRGVISSTQVPTKRARRTRGQFKGTPQHRYIPERHIRDGSKFCTFRRNVEGNNPIGHNVIERKGPHCARSKVPKEQRLKIGQFDEPADRDSVKRTQGRRSKGVNRFRHRGCGGHFRGHKDRDQYYCILPIRAPGSILEHPFTQLEALFRGALFERIPHYNPNYFFKKT